MQYGMLATIFMITAVTGFFIIIFVVWLDELVDLPHMTFGSPATPINYIESIIETIAISLFSHGVCPECATKHYGDI